MHCFLGGFRSCAECETGAESIELPDKIGRNRAYKHRLDGGLVENYCTSDLFHTDANPRRKEAWKKTKERPHLAFLIALKRPEKFHVGLPEEWGIGCGKVVIVCSCESQYTADRRQPVFLKFPVRYKRIVLA